MPRPAAPAPSNSPPADSLADALRQRVAGEIRFDRLARSLYATDASIYEIVPRGIVFPKTVEDVVATVQLCRAQGTPIVARGAGTGLAGGAVGAGVQLDLSRHMRRIRHIDPDARTAAVEPGVVLDELNAALAPHGLHFAPDLATSSRATIGGMIANNSCGAHSVYYGRTVDHLHAIEMVLADGERVKFDRRPAAHAVSPRAAKLTEGLRRIRDDNIEEIRARFPKVLRSNGGYGLDRLGDAGEKVDPIGALCGSEGTLGIVVEATLKLTPLPAKRGLLVLHFDDDITALRVVPAILRHNPAAVELVDDMIIKAGLRNPALSAGCGFLHGEPKALLVVELFGGSESETAEKLQAVADDSEATATSSAKPIILDNDNQKDVWALRNAGLGLLMSTPGDQQSYAFVEDSAVDPARLADYITDFARILENEGVKAGYYAHASVGCIHVRPVLNLKRAEDVARMGRIAEAASDLALTYQGAMTGEHGDGLVRSCWHEKMYGPCIVEAFRAVKRLFDPDGIMNPGKIVDAPPMTENLRFGSTFRSTPVRTTLDFEAHGGMAGLAGMCSGVGQCRQTLVGTMCPSYMATGDEMHTTRARANALRLALSNRGLLNGLDDPALDEVMDLCLSCKACRTECPTGVDMARLKAEVTSHRHMREGVPRRSRLIADLPFLAGWASMFPRIANRIGQSRLMRGFMERRYGLDHRMPPPRFARRTFRSWFRRHEQGKRTVSAPRGRVLYLVDTWTNYFTPEVGIAAVKLLEAAGFAVECPETLCCGRPAISKGLLTEARQLAEQNLRTLARSLHGAVGIVGTEPSCVLTLVDEYPQLVRNKVSRRVADHTMMIEHLLVRTRAENGPTLSFQAPPRQLLYHGHCHQKALIGTSDTMALLKWACGDQIEEINCGCCGMAGSFGHEAEHYDVARAVGAQRLFPAINQAPAADVCVSGFSCRQQLEHHAQRHPRHPIEFLAALLTQSDRPGA